MPWEMEDTPYPWFDPDSQSMVYGHRGDFRIDVISMIFNDRVIVIHKDSYDTSVVAGFCYDKGGVAVVAAMLWLDFWEEMDVPDGFKKEAFNALPSYGKGTR